MRQSSLPHTVRAVDLALALCLGLAVLVGLLLDVHPAQAQAPRKAVILSINDVYRIEGVNNGRSGSMARVRALRTELEETAPDLIFLHAGDFLSPSFLGRTYAGAHMIDVMNVMDGNPSSGSFDNRMFVAFGNHEFDDTNCSKQGPLPRLVAASEFTWLASNLEFSRCNSLLPLVGAPNIAATSIVESGGLKIGLLGVTLAYPEYAAVVLDPVAIACQKIEDLRASAVDVVVALTHLPWQTDLTLLGIGDDLQEMPPNQRPCKSPPDLIIGGHDHKSLALPSAAPRLFKADADAVSAWVVEIEKDGDALRINGRLVQLDPDRTPDPLVERITSDWLRRHDERFCIADCLGLARDKTKACLKAAEDGACLKQSYTRAASEIETEEITNKSYETGFGNWLADHVRSAGSVDVAFINAGAIRMNQSLPAGTVLTRRHLEQMFPYKGKLIVRQVPGGSLWRAMERAVAARGEGPWAHFSGMAVRIGEAGSPQKIARLRVQRHDGTVIEIGPDTPDMVSVASLAFVFANGDGHGFDLCASETVLAKCIEQLEAAPAWPLAGEGADIASLVRMKLAEVDPARGLELFVDRRLCDRGQTDCLIDRW